jgi:hypothetical protein
MKFYIATTLTNADAHNRLRDFLTSEGHAITYDWTAHGPVWNQGEDRIAAVAAAELQGVADADFVCVLLPGGRGTHTEMGAALALGKPVLLQVESEEDLEGPATCAFYHHPGVTLVGNAGQAWKDAIADLKPPLTIAGALDMKIATASPPIAHLLRFFRFSHLPPHLQAASEPFASLAIVIAHGSSNAETTVALRKLPA